jgi:hypothetical protein
VQLDDGVDHELTERLARYGASYGRASRAALARCVRP